MLQIDYRDTRSIYEQVADGIEEMAVRGVYTPDAQLPSVRQLATELSINPNTIQRAYAELEGRGVIYSVKGKGNFISADSEALRQRKICEIGEQVRTLVASARSLGADAKTIESWVEEENK